MENFLTQVSGILSTLDKNSAINILGNGESKLDLINNRKNTFDLFIQINNTLPNINNLFIVATRQEFLDKLQNTSKTNLVIAPDVFKGDFSFIKIPISENAHIEGFLRESSLPKFRFDFVLITILEILQFCANNIDKKIKINLAGFGLIQHKLNLNTHNEEYLNAFLDSQKNLYRLIIEKKDLFSNLAINSIDSPRIDNHKSIMSKQVNMPTNFDIEKLNKLNNEMLKDMLLPNVPKSPVVIAELTNNHLGDTERLIEMVDACVSQGANVIKIQKREPKHFYTESELKSHYLSPFGNTLAQYRAGVELTLDQIKYLHNYCVQKQIPWFSSVLDLPSYNKLNIFDLFAIKIPSTISQHKKFINNISQTNSKLILVSTGATNMEYVNWIINTFKSKFLVIMQCTSSYPCAAADCNINVIKSLKSVLVKNKVNGQLGYSSHDVGSLASQLALALGVKIFEKHVKLGSVPWVHFDSVALDLNEGALAAYVSDLATAHTMLGSGIKTVLPTEHHKYKPNQNHN